MYWHSAGTDTGPWPFHKQDTKPMRLDDRSSKWFITLTCSFSVFTDMFLYSLIIPVLPFALTERAGLRDDQVQHWTSLLLTIYAVCLLVGSPVAGWWSDRTETRKISFLVGLVALTISTIIFCLANSLALLVVGRIFQGLSGAIVWTVAMAIISDTYDDKEMGTALGYVTVARSSAVIAGPLIGGALYSKAGYYPVYSIAFACLALDIILRLLMIETVVARKWSSTSASPRSDARQDNTEPLPDLRGPSTIQILSSSTGRGGNPEKNGQFSHRTVRMGVALWGSLVQTILYGSFDATITIFVKDTFGWNALDAGLVLLALLVPTFVSPLVGLFVDRYGPRWFVVSGYLLTMIPLVLLRFVTEDITKQKILLCVLLAFTGGFSMLFEVPLWVEIVLTVREGRDNVQGTKGPYAQAFGLANLMAAIGMAIGPIWGGFTYEKFGWATMGYSLGILFAVSSMPSLVWTGGYIFQRK
ncbi:MFS general substrate transporter [Aspergillus pseudocaelatus]|uniref:MFS general substrate transporter n=1 Tax=Aspergillus pseudocaelatus TaxID=1825620 RepID=A0ABQ6W4R0_9EURO|nr:MFS general substrate transporter [Aspergillus pseudocaelatus]